MATGTPFHNECTGTGQEIYSKLESKQEAIRNLDNRLKYSNRAVITGFTTKYGQYVP